MAVNPLLARSVLPAVQSVHAEYKFAAVDFIAETVEFVPAGGAEAPAPEFIPYASSIGWVREITAFVRVGGWEVITYEVAEAS
mmetsp:Transcript_18056/g.37597  ORF Transcript_18056/g.37597 Transcript_18056/m.37597 type:complete len:83 (-) Transcript_18056:326-574(-)